MHQPRVMYRPEPGRQPGGQQPQRIGGRGPPVAHHLGQGRRGHVRRGQPRDGRVQVRGDHRNGERAIYPAGRGDLGPEPRVGGRVGLDDPHHDPLSVRRRAQEHPGLAQEQPRLAQLLDQLVRPDRCKRNYHPESPLSVAETAITRQFAS